MPSKVIWMHDPAERSTIIATHSPNQRYPLVPPPDKVLAGHFQERPGYAVHRPHGLRNWLLTLTVAGHGRYRWGDGELVTGPGDLVLVAPGVVQNYAVHAPPTAAETVWDFWWVHFQPRPAWFTWWRLPELSPGLHRAALGGVSLQRAVAAFERLHADAQLVAFPRADAPDAEPGGNELRRELALGAVEEILLLTAAEVRRGRQLPLDPRIRDVLDMITNAPAHPHRVASLAKAVALSPSRLAHLFRHQVGDSIMNVVLTLRLARAAQLLDVTDRPVATIASQVGFASPYYFSRQFRQRFGVSPTQYRDARAT